MIDQRFNLLDEPWLEVVTEDGGIDRLGMLDVFRRADSLRGLGQDLSTQRFAVLRVLLAFLHRALDGPTGEQWMRAWQNGLPIAQVEAYADRVRERFWLVHPTAPFFQTPSLQAPKGPEPGLRKIIADLPDGETLFTTRSTADAERVVWTEAAVCLIHAQAYDTAGIKTGAVDDPLVKSGKGYGYGLPAWAGQIGGISAQGTNLRETLLLNLIPPDYDAAEDLPAWERDVPTAWRGDDSEYEPRVSGPVQLMTWQARRILLEWDGDEAVGLTLCQGDRITPQLPPLHPLEGMTAWRYSKPQSTKLGTTIFMPQQHDPARQAWRGISRLLGLPAPTAEREDGVRAPVSRLVTWLSELEADGVGPSQVRIELAGYEYGAQNATFADVVDDSLAVPAVVLEDSEDALAWQAAVSQAVHQADGVAYAVRRFAENLAKASGQDRAELPLWQEQCFAALDGPLRAWITGLHVEGDLIAAKTKWQNECRRIALGLADELMLNLGAHAHAGHAPSAEEEPITPAKAWIWLSSALTKALPLTVPDLTQPTTQEDA